MRRGMEVVQGCIGPEVGPEVGPETRGEAAPGADGCGRSRFLRKHDPAHSSRALGRAERLRPERMGVGVHVSCGNMTLPTRRARWDARDGITLLDA